MFSGVSIPHRDSFLSTPLPRPGDSREGLLSALKVVIRKKAKQGGPFSFEIENTETRRPRNQVDPGILQQGFPLIRRGYSLERTGTMGESREEKKAEGCSTGRFKRGYAS